jgi:hypothetical protein
MWLGPGLELEPPRTALACRSTGQSPPGAWGAGATPLGLEPAAVAAAAWVLERLRR